LDKVAAATAPALAEAPTGQAAARQLHARPGQPAAARSEASATAPARASFSSAARKAATSGNPALPLRPAVVAEVAVQAAADGIGRGTQT
jgi:hypothetical protein